MSRTIKSLSLVLVAIAVIAVSVICSGGAVFAGGNVTAPDSAQITQPALLAQPVPPPSGFSPLTASKQELAKYGLPARPTDPTQLADWNAIMSKAKTWVSPGIPVVTNMTFSTLSTMSGNCWAGYQVRGTDNIYKQGFTTTYTQVAAVFTNPKTIPAKGIVALWVGIGGRQPNWDSYSPLIQAGTMTGLGCKTVGWGFASGAPCLWVEDYPATVVSLPSASTQMGIALGDSIYVSVSNNGATSTACFIDSTRNTYTSYTFSSPNQPNAAADFIYETPMLNKVGYPSTWGSTIFSSCQMVIKYGNTQTFKWIGEVNNIAILMYFNSEQLGFLSAINTNSAGFTVSYHAP